MLFLEDQVTKSLEKNSPDNHRRHSQQQTPVVTSSPVYEARVVTGWEEQTEPRRGAGSVALVHAMSYSPYSRPDPPTWINVELHLLYRWSRSDLTHCSCQGLFQGKETNVPSSRENFQQPKFFFRIQRSLNGHPCIAAWNLVRFGLSIFSAVLPRDGNISNNLICSHVLFYSSASVAAAAAAAKSAFRAGAFLFLRVLPHLNYTFSQLFASQSQSFSLL